jgi:integrating conjugative element protein (TIGR03761 family)
VSTTPPDAATAAAIKSTPAELAPLLEERPGVLRGGATLTLQTHQAQRRVKGRGHTAERPAIIGLLGFATLLRPIWHGARADDAYADWWMLKVHEALEQARLRIEGASREVTTRLETLEAIDVAEPSSLKPARVTLYFSNPYAFRGARLVGLYDGLVRMTLSARHVGLLTRDEAEQALHQGGRQIRRAFLSPLGYRLTGVSRRDLDQGTAKALQARDAMGEVPADVRRGERRAPHAASAFPPTPAAGIGHFQLRPPPDSLL